MKKTTTIFMALFLFATVISGQITIDRSLVNTVYALGNVQVSHDDTLITTISIGAPGNNTWDFSNIQSHSSVNNTSVDPATTPFIGDFPGATLAMKTQQEEMGMLADFYTYVTVTDDAFSVFGAKMEFTMQGMLLVMTLSNTPAEKSLIFPLTYLTEWNNVFDFTAGTTMNGMPVNSYTENTVIHYKCDAYGMAKMPDGNIVPALRIRQDERTYEATDNYYRREISYDIIGQNGVKVSFTAADTLAPDNGQIEVTDVSWTSTGTVDVKPENQAIPTDFTLSQNYPNPFNPSTTIKFSIPTQSFVTLTIYDALGKEVANLVNNDLPAGTYNAEWNATSSISAGVYFYQIKADNFTQTKKMLLIK